MPKCTGNHKFTLFISGGKHLEHVEAIRKLLNDHYDSDFCLDVINIDEEPQIAEEKNLVATPVL
ncbi:MAG: hypothetical protein GF349_04785 [Candidatus Magasanikbacteria bacterium]|nr:hypothetical protein [Candidatus Magasanikbacteria bacterium]